MATTAPSEEPATSKPVAEAVVDQVARTAVTAAVTAAAAIRKVIGAAAASGEHTADATTTVESPIAHDGEAAGTVAAMRRLAMRAAPQRFMVNHLQEADFKPDGLRTYALYRDLGVAAATGGLCQAHVIRLVPPCTDEVRKRHAHDTELQLVYVLKGWVKNEFAGHGEQMMSQGSCWIQPPGIPHTVLDYSADAELLEIVVPADFKTNEL